MPLTTILKGDSRLAFTAGRQSGIRANFETVEQLQQQLQREREQHRFDLARMEEGNAILSRELAEARLEICRLKRDFLLLGAPPASPSMH